MGGPGQRLETDSPSATKDEAVTKANQPTAKASKSSAPLDWLLSNEAFDLANPEIPEGHGEIDWDPATQNRKTPPISDTGRNSKGDGKILRYPQSHLTPFQNLVCASILSKPLSHKLGLRTIQTLLNPPFSLRTWNDLDEAGYEGRRKVMWEARTQHKEKTASLLGDLCEGVKDLCGEDERDLSKLSGVRDQVKDIKDPVEAQKKVVDILTGIKGIGPGGAAIFLRRAQMDWEEVFPFADDKSLSAARKFGLIKDGGGAKELATAVGEDKQKYVRLVDTLVGLELEKKIDDAVEKAGA